MTTAATGLFRVSVRRGSCATPGARAALGASASASARSGTAAAPEHLQLVTEDLGRVARVALLVLPLAGAQAPLDVDLRALAQVFTGDFGQPAKERDPVPLGTLLLLAALLVAPALARRDAQIRHRGAGGHGARLWIRAQVANEND